MEEREPTQNYHPDHQTHPTHPRPLARVCLKDSEIFPVLANWVKAALFGGVFGLPEAELFLPAAAWAFPASSPRYFVTAICTTEGIFEGCLRHA